MFATTKFVMWYSVNVLFTADPKMAKTYFQCCSKSPGFVECRKKKGNSTKESTGHCLVVYIKEKNLLHM